MGGSALGRPARRLTTSQFNLLIEHCVSRLSPSVFPTVIALTPPRDKASHGDVDLLCSFDENIDGKKVKGEDWGVIINGEDKGVGSHHPVQPLSETKRIEEKEQQSGEENKAFRDWTVSVVKKIGGSEWKRSGTNGVVISAAVPCSVLVGVELELDEEKAKLEKEQGYDVSNSSDSQINPQADAERYFQVDIQLVPAQYIHFTSFTRSYSNTILSHAVSYLSPSIKLHGTHLGLRYSPYFGLKPIKVELTSSPAELCKWLGLDVAIMDNGFDSEKQLWVWATTVQPGGKIDKAWRIVTNPRRATEKTGKHNKVKDEAWMRFIGWLRRGEDSPYGHRQRKASDQEESGKAQFETSQGGGATMQSPDTKSKGESTKKDEGMIDRPSTKKSSVADAQTEDSGTNLTLPRPIDIPLPVSPSIVKVLSPFPESSTVALVAAGNARKSIVDPDCPAQLDQLAKETVEMFGKSRQVDDLFKDRMEKAILLAERQKKKIAELEASASEAAEGGIASMVAVEAVPLDDMVLEPQMEKLAMTG